MDSQTRIEMAGASPLSSQKAIYKDGELDEEATHKKYLLVRQEGKRQVQREIDHYNLDMIIALGYRVQSPIAVQVWLK